MTASPTASLSLSLSSSENAWRKLRSTGSCTWLLLSHVLSLSIVLFIEADKGLPDASLSTGPIIVASPISCMARDVGMPVLLLSSCSSFEKALHSGPSSSILSLTTKPQLPQNISPLELSVTIEPLPQRGHRSPNIEISFTNFSTKISWLSVSRYKYFILLYKVYADYTLVRKASYLGVFRLLLSAFACFLLADLWALYA